jgi:hypothetical protein
MEATLCTAIFFPFVDGAQLNQSFIHDQFSNVTNFEFFKAFRFTSRWWRKLTTFCPVFVRCHRVIWSTETGFEHQLENEHPFILLRPCTERRKLLFCVTFLISALSSLLFVPISFCCYQNGPRKVLFKILYKKLMMVTQLFRNT